MRRNKELALLLLELIHDMERTTGVDERNITRNVERQLPAFQDEITYHLGLLVSGGFLRSTEDPATFVASYFMTWSGHDLLERLFQEVSTQ